MNANDSIDNNCADDREMGQVDSRFDAKFFS